MKITTKHQHSRAFTLIEIVGVVAIIAILAAVLTPRVVMVIARSKVNSTAQSLSGLKTATMDYLAKNASLPSRDGTGSTNAAVATGRFDADLVAGGYLEKLFSCSIGSQTFDSSALSARTHIRSQSATASGTVSTPTSTAGGGNFDLDRDASSADFASNQVVVSAFIPSVSISDAVELNKLIDGDSNSTSGADIVGRCIYSTPSTDGRVTVYVYVAHH